MSWISLRPYMHPSSQHHTLMMFQSKSTENTSKCHLYVCGIIVFIHMHKQDQVFPRNLLFRSWSDVYWLFRRSVLKQPMCSNWYATSGYHPALVHRSRSASICPLCYRWQFMPARRGKTLCALSTIWMYSTSGVSDAFSTSRTTTALLMKIF